MEFDADGGVVSLTLGGNNCLSELSSDIQKLDM
eukprot:CAMPEP_0178862214 /NCGR_PEP_ID=MMETSP0747-20121128/2692_1 /TAXON_ID=913974 /ORGANISM="Nitzschia punctata, Strain CCMP561" /LENGTH=32 /DNA_ID= /DNA_START= /DNA_END= /DNA_ORIENTATION=